MIDDSSTEIGDACGTEAEPSSQALTLYIPDRDRHGEELGTQRQWVLEAARLLARIGGGVTIERAVEGGWLDPDSREVLWERPVMLYTFVRPDALEELLPELRRFLHRMGREANQGEVAFEIDGLFYRIRRFD